MVIFYIIRNLIRMLIAAILLPIALFTRRFSSIIVMVIAGVILWQCMMDTPTTKRQGPVGADGQPVVYIDPVKKEEDGNSVFATDLIQKMREDERITYSQHFYWGLNNGSEGQKYTWNQHNIAGEITIKKVFKSKGGADCKRFYEVLKVHEIRQTLEGMACARGDGSWCKLRRDATPACGLGRDAGFLDSISMKINRWF